MKGLWFMIGWSKVAPLLGLAYSRVSQQGPRELCLVMWQRKSGSWQAGVAVSMSNGL
jgi:hypothetical protein